MRKIIVVVLGLLSILTGSAQKVTQDVTLQQIYEELSAADKVQILDTRSANEFEVNHLEGAVQVDLTDSIQLSRTIASLDPNVLTLTYSIGAGRSVRLAKLLKEEGFSKVYFMPRGIPEWVAAGYPIVSNVKSEYTPEQISELLKSHDVVFIDYASRHCPGCVKLQPVVEELKAEYAGRVDVLRIELDENIDVIKAQKISLLPTLRLYKKGEQVWEHIGNLPKEKIVSQINKAL